MSTRGPLKGLFSNIFKPTIKERLTSTGAGTGIFEVDGIVDKKTFAENIMRENEITKQRLAIERDLTAMGKKGSELWNVVQEHYKHINDEIQTLYDTFLKYVQLSYDLGDSLEESQAKAYDDIQAGVTRAKQSAAKKHPITGIAGLTKNATLTV